MLQTPREMWIPVFRFSKRFSLWTDAERHFLCQPTTREWYYICETQCQESFELNRPSIPFNSIQFIRIETILNEVSAILCWMTLRQTTKPPCNLKVSLKLTQFEYGKIANEWNEFWNDRSVAWANIEFRLRNCKFTWCGFLKIFPTYPISIWFWMHFQVLI